jgi:nucleotide-binding universal stress UspA family protein
MKSILVPVDFSEPSGEAMRVAIDLASRYNAVVKLLHVQGVPMTDPYAEVGTAEVDAMLEERLHERLRKLVTATSKESSELKAKMDAISFETVVRTGFAAGEISRLAREEEVDWVVMGTRGGGGVAGSLFGSVTAAVVGRADRPVLAVPHGVKRGDFQHIVCAIESPLENGKLLRELDEFAYKCEAELTFVHVVEESNVISTGVTAGTLSAYKALHGHVEATAQAVSGEDVEDALTEYCHNNHADLLVMVREHHPFLQKLIHRSVTRRLALHASIPLLIFPPQ